MAGTRGWRLLLPCLCLAGLWLAAAADQQPGGGLLGCRFTEDVCRDNERCFNDGLFGTCKASARDLYVYELDKETYRVLQGELQRLVTLRFTWKNAYTQCVVGNVLLSFRIGVAYNPRLCDAEAEAEEQRLAEEAEEMVENYVENQEKRRDGMAEAVRVDLENAVPLLQEPAKKDEVVDVHKYLANKKSAESWLQTLSPDEQRLLLQYLNADDEPLQNVDQEAAEGLPLDEARLLNALLNHEISVQQLSPSQVNRMTAYIQQLLASFDQRDAAGALESLEETPLEIDMKPAVTSHKKIAPDVKKGVAMEMEAEKKAAPRAERLPTPREEAEVEKTAGDHHDHHFQDSALHTPAAPAAKYELLDTNYAYVQLDSTLSSDEAGLELVAAIETGLGLPLNTLTDVQLHDNEITFRVDPNPRGINASLVANFVLSHADQLRNQTGLRVASTGIGREARVSAAAAADVASHRLFVITFSLCGSVGAILIAVIAVFARQKYVKKRQKLSQLAAPPDGVQATKDYQDLCRQRMQTKSSERPEPVHVAATRVGSASEKPDAVNSPSSRSSTSSWSEEPVHSQMDISTGHLVLSYMEDHLKNKKKLTEEWDSLCAYEAEPNQTSVASEPANARKNRYDDVLPYDHSRVTLNKNANVSGCDYVNANSIMDHDPRSPAYIVTQGPLAHTVADFWQMVWEQGSVVIVTLTRLAEKGAGLCHRYWPEEGSDLYHIYEVHLVSEHIWCEDYLVRSFYLKNLQTNETRTVTQFHFLSWPDLGVPASSKALLDFRRKVNKSYRGRSCPIVVHCSDGAGRAGTYCLIDMVLNRMNKGAKEIDIAATLEHIRDQRMLMVKTKEQFEFALSTVAEEVHAILKALPQ